MPPAIAPGTQMWRAGSTVWNKRRGGFFDAKALQGGFDHHFGGKFHARRIQIEACDRIARKSTQAAMEVADLDAIEQASNET